MGKLIVFEGIDGSGKSTQIKRLCEHLEKTGAGYRRLAFPQYNEPSSALLKMYLAGEFGDNPNDVNAYAASTFFAVDRFASYAKSWRAYYQSGGTLVTDRYTTSNAIHQGAKLSESERQAFFKWLYDFEFNLMELPKPDVVLYMDIPLETAVARIASREAKTGSASDIHERDVAYLKRCHACGDQAARYYGWRKIACCRDGTALSEDDIHGEVLAVLKDMGYFV
jgi:dTMP kinase